jgi:hypothetical protein
VVHVNVNCWRLEPVTPHRDALSSRCSHTKPPPQDGAGFGMPGHVQWDAIIHDDCGQAA